MTIPTTLSGISYDAQDAAVSADFWAALLGRTVSPRASSESASIAPGDDPSSGPTLMFHRVPEAKTVKNRIHFDLVTTAFDAELARVVGLGATVRASFESWTTLADPEGNEFDLIGAERGGQGGALDRSVRCHRSWPERQ